MKKLRFFGLLAVALLAFALVVSCGDAGGGPSTPPGGVVPPGTDGPQYPAYPGGTGASGIPIKLPAEEATGFSLSPEALSLKIGAQVTLTFTATPGDAGIEEILWTKAATTGSAQDADVAITYLGDDPKKSFKVQITGVAEDDTDGPAVVTVTATPQRKKADGTPGTEAIPDSAVSCEITVYNPTGLAGEAAKIAKLSWDDIAGLLKSEGLTPADVAAGVTEKIITAPASANAAAKKRLAGDFIGAAYDDVDPRNSNNYLWQAAADVPGGPSTPAGPFLTYYAVLADASTFTFDFPEGWRFATAAEGQLSDAPILGENTLKVEDRKFDEFFAVLIYPVPGQTAPLIKVRVVPGASISFVMSKTAVSALVTDGIMTLTSGATDKDIFAIGDSFPTPATSLTGVKSVGGEVKRTFFIASSDPNTRIGVRTSIAADTRYTVSPLPAGYSKTTTNEMDMYSYAGGLAGRRYTVEITRASASITGITIDDIDQPAINATPTVQASAKITTTSNPAIANAAELKSSDGLTWYSDATAKTALPAGNITTRPASNRIYAKIILEQKAPYTFKTGFAASDITWGDDIAGTTDIDDYAGVQTIKIEDNGNLTVILWFTVATQKITAANIAFTAPADEGDTVPKYATITSTPAGGLVGDVKIDWAFEPDDEETWIEGAGAEKGTYTATIKLTQVTGFEFNTVAADEKFDTAAHAKAVVQLGGSALGTDDTVSTPASGVVTVVLKFEVT